MVVPKSPSRRTLNHESPNVLKGKPSLATLPSPSAAATSTTTVSSLPACSPPPTIGLHPPLFQTEYYQTAVSNVPSVRLSVHPQSTSDGIPTYNGGDIITGIVVLNLTPKEAQYVTAVEIELHGEVFPKGKTPHRFLDQRSTLWSSSPSANNNDMTAAFSHIERVEEKEYPGITQILSVPPDTGRLTNPPHGLFRSTLQSIGRSIGREHDVEDPLPKMIPTQVKKPQIRLEPSREHTWPFELEIPSYISSSGNANHRRPVSRSSKSPHYVILHPEDLDEDLTEATNEEGGVRTERIGYGVGLDPSEEGYFQQESFKDIMHQEGDEDPIGQTLLNGTPRIIVFDESTKNGANFTQNVAQRPVVTTGSGQRTYKLPPSFSESECAACIEYELVVMVHKRGALRWGKRPANANSADSSGRISPAISPTLLVISFLNRTSLTNLSMLFLPGSRRAKLHISHSSYPRAGPGPGLSLHRTHPVVVASRLPGPLENPDGWNIMPEVVMHLQPPGRRSGGAITNGAATEVVLKLALSRPLCYARGTAIPFRITVSIPYPHKPVPKGKQELSSTKKSRVPVVLTSYASSAPSFVLGVTPPLQLGAHGSGPSPPTSRQAEEPSVSRVPSGDAIASSIRLVRAIHAGPHADDDNKNSRECASFLHTVATAVMLHDEPVNRGKIDADHNAEKTASSLRGWKAEKGWLVRTFVGEIPLKEDIKPSFMFSHFALQYAVVLFPFEFPGFTPTSNDLLWSEPVTIAQQVEPKSTALGSEESSVIDKADREIYTRYIASFDQ